MRIARNLPVSRGAGLLTGNAIWKLWLQLHRTVSCFYAHAAHAERPGFGFTLSIEGGCFAERRIIIA
jgi:hypothetical protein